MSKYEPVSGIITSIEAINTGRNSENNCCTLIMSVRALNRNVVNFIVDNNTYFIDNVTLGVGDRVIGFYDSSLPTPAIYPPQYRAVVMARRLRNRNIVVDKFDRDYLSSEENLMLNIVPDTRIIMRNNQNFLCNIFGRVVAVVYTASTKSIPAVIIPSQIVVLCK